MLVPLDSLEEIELAQQDGQDDEAAGLLTDDAHTREHPGSALGRRYVGHDSYDSWLRPTSGSLWVASLPLESP